MLDKFKARLKAKAKALGVNLSTTRIDAIAARLHAKNPDITEDADHDSRIDDFNDLQPLADIAKQDDRVRTLEAKTKAQPTDQDQDDTDDDDDDEPAEPKQKGKIKKKKSDQEPPSWAKSLIETVNKLNTEKVQTSMQARAKEKLKDVPEKFYAGRTLPEKDDDLDSFVENVNNDYTAFKQDLINKGLMSSTPPAGGGTTIKTDSVDADITAWANKGKPANPAAKT